MDIIIEEEVSAKKRKKTIILVFIVLVLIISSVLILRSFFKPAIDPAEFVTAKAAVGNIENTINATGEVLPEFEEILTSPINAALRNVIMDAGTKVKAGQSILTLDKSAAQTDVDKLKFQIESKENEIRKLKLDLTKTFYDINSNNNIKQLRISNLKDAVSSAKRLFKAGGGTKEEIDQAELNLKVAELEKQQLENEIKNKQQTMKIEIREAEIALAIQRNEQAALTRKLDLANIVATRDGVVTWVNKNIGASIKEGESLARIADLSSYKLAGSISDNFLDQIHNNMVAIIKINDSQLRGSIVNVSPSVNNAIVSFDIKLDEKNNKLLRPNMKVDVFLITETRNQVVRIENGPAFKGSNLQEVFVIKGDKAERRTVKTGLSNFDYIEILSGIKAGETVITSDMSNYLHTKEIVINK
ncbi:efflux RND transporter periplasmic adaptor subunit [Pedobacter metabolipauper]|uniref:HlyD family secretion protein n=1 Tax=Pedobacter metabolipauper TaxID=425513 RepID=A0A4R6T0H5_9SPHI|nr:HlyD family efflux transporter periplasmic adaptor subunit [Pedobacter metabolipauper]TDQ11912.1 HlyD family secretion protein [Pedobacter metabolipauper]